MKKNSLIISALITVFIISCSSESKKDTQVTEQKKDIQTKQAGWTDNDTYTVTVSDKNESKAIDKAKHKILKDIVNARVRNGSKYTDIAKISTEFEKPMENGRIISKKESADGVEIFYQIKDKGLKEKFEKK